jgi:hypothetical protein
VPGPADLSSRRRRRQIGPGSGASHQPVDGGPGVPGVHAVAVELDRVSGAQRRAVGGDHGRANRPAVAEQLERRGWRAHRNARREERVGRDPHHPGTGDSELHRDGAGELPLLALEQAGRPRGGCGEGNGTRGRGPRQERVRIPHQIRGERRRGPRGGDRSRPARPSIGVERLDQVRRSGHCSAVFPARVPSAQQADPATQHRPGDQARRQQLASAGHLAPHAEAHEVRARPGPHRDDHPARRGAHRGSEVDRPGGNDGVDRDRQRARRDSRARASSSSSR